MPGRQSQKKWMRTSGRIQVPDGHRRLELSKLKPAKGRNGYFQFHLPGCPTVQIPGLMHLALAGFCVEAGSWVLVLVCVFIQPRSSAVSLTRRYPCHLCGTFRISADDVAKEMTIRNRELQIGDFSHEVAMRLALLFVPHKRLERKRFTPKKSA